MRYLAIIFLFISTYSVGQITVNTNFLPNIASPIDTRQKIATLADTTSIPFQYTGAICYVTSKDSIYYKGTNGWKAIGKRGSGGGGGTVTSVAATNGTGISISGSPITTSGTLTITNTAPDQTVVITGATGTYPNFALPAETGDISGVTAIAPITGGGTSGSVSIAIDTASSVGVATQYDLTQLNSVTNLTISGTVSPLTLNNSAGTDVTITAGTGISLAGTSGNATITNSSPDQTVGITGAGITNVTGTYPNFTVTSTEVGDISSVTVSAPITGGSTSGVANIALDTTSSSGAATQYDLTLKQNTLVSGTSIKTVNSNSLLGSGNVSITPESTTVGDTPTLNLSLSGVNITGVVDTSIIATQYDLTLVDGGGGGDSIYSRNDTIFLRDGSGFVVPDSIVNQLQKISTNGSPGHISLSLGGNTLTLNVNDSDASTTNELTTFWFSTPPAFIPKRGDVWKESGVVKMHNGGSDWVDISYLSIDSTNIIGGWGLDATESPANTWNLIGDSSQVATQYDLTLRENPLTFTSPLSRSTNTISIPAATSSVSGHLTSTDWNLFNGKVGGSGTSTRVAFWSGSSALSSNANLYWDNTNSRLGIGTASPSKALQVTTDININGMNLGLGGGNLTSNISFGNNALVSNTTGYNNLAVGFESMVSNTTGFENVSLGFAAMQLNTSGYGNIALGLGAMQYNTTGYYNLGQGIFSLRNNTTGTKNLALGFFSATANTTGANNAAIGAYALGTNITGSTNVAIGGSSLYGVLGSGNIGIGYQAGYSETGSNKLYIENTTSSTPLIGGDFSTDKVGINTAIGSIARTLHVTGEARITDLTTDTPTRLIGADADGDIAEVGLSGLSMVGGVLTATGSDQYLNPYIQAGDTTGFFLTVAQDTVVFISGADSGEATTVGDTPTIDMTLTGVNITADVKDGSITPAKLDRAYAAVSLKATTTTFATSSTTAAEWTGGNFRDTIDATGYYKIELYGIFKSSATTTGGAYSIYSAGGTQVAGILDIANNKGFGTTTINRTQADNMNNYISGTGASNTTENHTLYGQLTGYFTSGDIIIPKFGSEIAASTVTYQAGTRLIITKLF